METQRQTGDDWEIVMGRARQRNTILMGALCALACVANPVAAVADAGGAGYFFQQLTGDSGPGATLGPFKGRTVGIGPQIGFIFPVSEGYQGYLNLRGYKDLAVENRPEGWTAWLTFAVSPAPPEAPSKPLVRKY